MKYLQFLCVAFHLPIALFFAIGAVLFLGQLLGIYP